MKDNIDKDCYKSSRHIQKVCIIAPDIYLDGGVPLATRELAKALAKNGLEVHIISNEENEDPDFSKLDNIKVHNFKSSLKLFPFSEIEFAIRAAKKLNAINENFDVIHTIGPIILMRQFSRKYHFSLWVTTAQGTLKSLLRWMHHFPFRGKARLIYFFSTYLTYYYEKLIYCLLQPYTIAVSCTTRKELIELGLIREKTFVIPNGVDLYWPTKILKYDSGTQLSKALEHDHDIVLFVGDITPRKGVHLLIEAIPDILSVKKNVTFVFVGQVNLSNYFSYLKSRVKQYQDHIFFTGFVPHCLLPMYYSRCNLFVLPSYSEGAPLAVPEAMAFKKPVIATSACVPDKYLEKECIFEMGNSKELAEKIISFLTNQELSERIAHKLWLKTKDLSWEKIAESTLSLYIKLKLISIAGH